MKKWDAEPQSGINFDPDHPRVVVGDVLISRKGNYHYLVETINGNDARIRWLHRVKNETSRLYPYTRMITLDSMPRHYQVVPARLVDWSAYSNIEGPVHKEE